MQEWISIERAALFLGLSGRTVQRYCAKGELVGRKVGPGGLKSWEVSLPSVRAFRDAAAARVVTADDATDAIDAAAIVTPAPDVSDVPAPLLAHTLAQIQQQLGTRLDVQERLIAAERCAAEQQARAEAAEREREDWRQQAERVGDLVAAIEAERARPWWRFW